MKNKTKELKFNKKIYKKKIIKVAIASFADLAEFAIQTSKSYFFVKINVKDDVDDEKLLNEFVNYVLYSMKNT